MHFTSFTEAINSTNGSSLNHCTIHNHLLQLLPLNVRSFFYTIQDRDVSVKANAAVLRQHAYKRQVLPYIGTHSRYSSRLNLSSVNRMRLEGRHTNICKTSGVRACLSCTLTYKTIPDCPGLYYTNLQKA